MKYEFLAVCDYAAADAAGKLTVVGIFDRFFAPQIPFAVPQMGIAIKLRMENGDPPSGTHQIEVRIKAPNGTIVGKMDAQAATGALPPGDTLDMNSLQLAMMLQNFAFTAYGKYSVELWLDKKLIGTAPIFVGKPVAAKTA